MTVQEIIAIKLTGITIAAPIISLSILETEQAIISYCNIDTVPEALNYTWANMAIDLAKYTNESTTAGGGMDTIDMLDVSSLKVGDTQVSLQGGSGSSERAKALNSHKASLDNLIMNYKDQLGKFRRMVW